MAKFVFVVPPLTGHVNPTMTIGAVLLKRGHRVGWITFDETLIQRLPTGGELLLIEYDHQHKQEIKDYLDTITKKIVYGIESIKFLYQEVLIPLNRYSYNGIAAWLDKFQPDLVITDHQMFAGSIAAENKGLPYATSVTAPAAIKAIAELPKVHEWEVSQVVALQRELGVNKSFIYRLLKSAHYGFNFQVVFGEMKLASYYRFTGPVTNSRTVNAKFKWAQLFKHNRPKVLVSIGTTFDYEYKKAFFAKVTEALAGESLTVVVVSDPALFEHWPNNFIVQAQVPQLELLPHINAVICHGGHNTVCESLLNGLPLVVIPIAYDQSYVAGRVVGTGAGLRLNFNRFKANHLKEALAEVLSNPSFKAAALQLRDSFVDAGGVEAAADMLEQVSTAQVLQTFNN